MEGFKSLSVCVASDPLRSATLPFALPSFLAAPSSALSGPSLSLALALSICLSLSLSMGSGCSSGGAGGWCDGSAVWCRRWSGWTSRQRGRSELSASASPRVTFHGQLVSEQRRTRCLSAPLIVKISGNQCARCSALSAAPFTSASDTHSCVPVFVCCCSVCGSPLMCLCTSPANGWHLAICYLTVQFLLSLEINS